MHVKSMLSLSAAVIVAVVLISAAGARSAAPRHIAKIDVSTRAAAVKYLRSIHVNPRGLVIQRGTHNYAGPKCPGRGWTCTSTAHPVVQTAAAGGKNEFACAGSQCAVVQTAAPAATNTAKCVKTSGVSQSCSISQTSTSADNLAIVYMSAVKTTGLTQDASQTANIVQRATGGPGVHNNNRACVTQFMKLDTMTVASRGMPVLATLDGHQKLDIKQDSSHGNNNASEAATAASGGSCGTAMLGQQQIIKQTAQGGGRIEQDENSHNQGPNLSLDIEQNKNGGGLGQNNTNDAVFFQDNALTAIAKTPSASVFQTQGTVNGGLLADVNQFAHGHSNADAHQSEIQCEHATGNGALTCTTGGTVQYNQTQHGPLRKSPGDSSQTGNEDCSPTCDSFTVTQGSTQDNDTHGGQTNVVEGGFSTDGSGTVNQTTTVNGDTTQATQSGQNVDSSINCSGSSCTATGPPTPTIDSAPPNPSDSSDATFTFSDADPTATFLCKLDTGDYTPCTSPQNYSELADGSHTFSVEATDAYGNASDPATYTWTIATSAGNANVLIAGSGDVGNPEPNNNLAQLLTGAGYSVTESATLPADLSSFGQVWWVDSNPPTSDEQNQLIAFAQSGKGVYLTGERPCCEALNAADQTIVNSLVTGGGITVGGQGDVCSCNAPLPVNPTVVGGVATQPFTVTTWTPASPGGMANVPASSVFSYYQPGDPSTRQVVAAVWDRPNLVGNGRLVVFMDVNWPEAAWRAANWFEVAQNVAFFLSGLGSPPGPPLVSGTSVATLAPALSVARQATPARVPDTASGGSTR
jgi:hypothetical protein